VAKFGVVLLAELACMRELRNSNVKFSCSLSGGDWLVLRNPNVISSCLLSGRECLVGCAGGDSDSLRSGRLVFRGLDAGLGDELGVVDPAIWSSGPCVASWTQVGNGSFLSVEFRRGTEIARSSLFRIALYRVDAGRVGESGGSDDLISRSIGRV